MAATEIRNQGHVKFVIRYSHRTDCVDSSTIHTVRGYDIVFLQVILKTVGQRKKTLLFVSNNRWTTRLTEPASNKIIIIVVVVCMAIICFNVYCPPLLPCASDCVRTPRFRKTPAQTDNRRDVLDALLSDYSNYGARHSAQHRRQSDRLPLSIHVFVYTHTYTHTT